MKSRTHPSRELQQPKRKKEKEKQEKEKKEKEKKEKEGKGEKGRRNGRRKKRKKKRKNDKLDKPGVPVVPDAKAKTHPRPKGRGKESRSESPNGGEKGPCYFYLVKRDCENGNDCPFTFLRSASPSEEGIRYVVIFRRGIGVHIRAERKSWLLRPSRLQRRLLHCLPQCHSYEAAGQRIRGWFTMEESHGSYPKALQP